MNLEIEAIKQHMDELAARLAAQQIALKFLAKDLTTEQLHDLAGFAAWEHAQLRHTTMTDRQIGLVPIHFQKLFESLLAKTPTRHHENSIVDTGKLPFPW